MDEPVSDSLPPELLVLTLLESGEAARALEVADEAIRQGVAGADLYNLAGTCAAALGELSRAGQLWQCAVEAFPAFGGAWFNLGLLRENAGRHEDAEGCYRRAMECGADDACVRLADMLAARGEQHEAEIFYRRAIACDPEDAHSHANLGVAFAAMHRLPEAEESYRHALALDAENAGTHSNLGVLLVAMRRDEEAEQCYRHAIALAPSFAHPHTNLGLLLETCGRMDEAEQLHRRAIELAPMHTEIHSNLGNLLTTLRREPEAEQCHRHALALAPDSPASHLNLGVLLANVRQEAEAEKCFRQAMALQPDYPLPRLNLAFLLLAQARFNEGWTLHEARYDPRLPDKINPPPAFPFPQWQGEPLTGKSLLVWQEQGLGDEIQFCRYLPLLSRRWQVRITLVCKAALAPLMKTLAGVAEVVALEDAMVQGVQDHDYWVLPLSIPLHSGAGLPVPCELPYLHVPVVHAARWAHTLSGQDLRVGLVWKGNPHHSNDRYRSLPSLATLAPLWTVPGVCFVSLQVGAGAEEALQLTQQQAMLDPTPEIRDFADTAALLMQLDLVISVDSAVAHLAGALNKPCWVLLPAYRTDWRWQKDRADTPWYPDVMTLFRQDRTEDWAPVMASVAAALGEAAAKKARAALLPEKFE